MFPFTHTYILKELYKDKEIPAEIILGNIMLDIVGSFELRENGKEKTNERNIQRELHDHIKSEMPSEDNYGSYGLKNSFHRGIIIHVMADNYSRVGRYWRVNPPKTHGFLKKLEGSVEFYGLKIPEGKEGDFQRKTLQSGLDILVLRERKEEQRYLVGRAMDYLRENQAELKEEMNKLTDVNIEDIQKTFDDVLSTYGTDFDRNILEPIRAYPAIRVAENFGNTQLSDEFIAKLEKHEGYEAVLKNLKLLEGIWKEHLRETADAIAESPVNIYI